MDIFRQILDKECMVKRGVAFFLAWVMLLSAVPVQVFADGDVPAPTEEILVDTTTEEKPN